MTLFKFVTFVVPGKYVVFRLFVALLSAYKRTSLSSVDRKRSTAVYVMITGGQRIIEIGEHWLRSRGAYRCT